MDSIQEKALKMAFSFSVHFVCTFFKKYHDLPSTTSCEGVAVVFVRNSPE
jgi:hypothetical protein